MDRLWTSEVLKLVMDRYAFQADDMILAPLPDEPFVRVNIRDAKFTLRGNFDNDNIVAIFPERYLGKNLPCFLTKYCQTGVKNVQLVFFEFPSVGNLRLNIGGCDDLFVNFSGLRLSADFNLWQRSVVIVGQNVTCNEARIVVDDSVTTLGANSMLSDGIIFQSSDQHAVVDVATLKAINSRPTFIHVGKHCWIGRRAFLMKNVTIGHGSIVAACSVVTKSCDNLCAIAGVPAKVVKRDVSWSRDPLKPEPLACDIIRKLRDQAAAGDAPAGESAVESTPVDYDVVIELCEQLKAVSAERDKCLDERAGLQAALDREQRLVAELRGQVFRAN